MSIGEIRDGRAFLLRLVLAELVAKRGEGPLAPRFAHWARSLEPNERRARGAGRDDGEERR